MSTPVQTDTPSENDTLASRVNSAVSAMTYDKEKQQWMLPAGLTEAEKFCATAEKRVRDNQANQTKLAQKNKILIADKENLLSQLKSDSRVVIPTEKQEELNSLKYSDPEKWRQEMNTLEVTLTAERDSKINEGLVANEQQAALEEQELALQNFNQANPGLEVTRSVIQNDIPPRITKDWETGKLSSKEFLEEVKKYMTSGKSIHQSDGALDQPNLGNVGGGASPGESGGSSKKDDFYSNPAL